MLMPAQTKPKSFESEFVYPEQMISVFASVL